MKRKSTQSNKSVSCSGVRWVKFEGEWLPPRSDNRPRILQLLKNDESALADIESALSRYFALKPDAMSPAETAKKVRDDLESLATAISITKEILQSRSQARSLFLAACGEYLEDGVFIRFEQLEGALRGDGGDMLVEAAQSALTGLKVASGRPPSSEAIGRVYLVKEIMSVAEKIGIRPVRGGDFEELVQLVYESAGIETSRSETIKAEGDIRKAQE